MISKRKLSRIVAEYEREIARLNMAIIQLAAEKEERCAELEIKVQEQAEQIVMLRLQAESEQISKLKRGDDSADRN